MGVSRTIMANRPYFPTTAEALQAITGLYDFVWPTAIALWNLRWQVAGYCTVRPSATVAELRSRFAEGSSITGANLRRACLQMTWDQQTASLGAVLLTNLFAIYEGWAKRTVAALSLKSSFEAALQKTGLTALLASLQPRSTLLDSAVYPVLKRNSRINLAKLDNWLVCYRYFKAVRNKQLHDHGIADKKAEQSYAAFAVVATKSALGVKEVPEHFPVVAGSPVRLTLRGAVGFSDVLFRTLLTIDAELSRLAVAEPVFASRWKNHRSPSRVFKSSASDRRKQIGNVLKRMGFAGLVVTPALEAELRARGLANWN